MWYFANALDDCVMLLQSLRSWVYQHHLGRCVMLGLVHDASGCTPRHALSLEEC